jgi:hypothetical protein
MAGVRQHSRGIPGARPLLCLSKGEDRYAFRICHIIGGAELGFLITAFPNEPTSAPGAGLCPPIIPEMQAL